MKASIPDTHEAKGEFAKKLMKYGVSLLEYAQTSQQEEIRWKKSLCIQTCVIFVHFFNVP